ncbi:unnamed protein product [Paramecium sonneborni]|uniref:Uncharacterized protein n=1 Tax=Paramecium sonneborni TaxID=65129 RepID=A0A8S1PL74_9CILI|nr:unnamed protein product [Paramecium sonneborni]
MAKQILKIRDKLILNQLNTIKILKKDKIINRQNNLTLLSDRQIRIQKETLIDKINREQISNQERYQDEVRKEKKKWESQYHLLQGQFDEINKNTTNLNLQDKRWKESENRRSQLEIKQNDQIRR